MPTDAEWRKHLEDEANSAKAVRDVLAQLAHAKHPEHILDPSVRTAMRKMDVAISRQLRSAAKLQGTPHRIPGNPRGGHGRGKSKDVED